MVQSTLATSPGRNKGRGATSTRPFVALALVALFNTTCGAQDRYFNANGVRLRYTDQGAGEPIVLVHGFSNQLELWTTTGVVQDLARDHRVIAFDLRGHGRSDKPHDPARYGREMTLDIVRLLDHLGIDRAHIVGYSLGAHLTSQLLTLHPERFLSATLVAGAGRFDWDSATARQADTVAREVEHDCISRSLIRRLAPPTMQPPEDTLRALAARCLADTTQDRQRLDRGDRAAQVSGSGRTDWSRSQQRLPIARRPAGRGPRRAAGF